MFVSSLIHVVLY